MKQMIIAALIVGYFLWPACHDLEVLPRTEPPLTCEDTIEINHPGKMEHGFLKAVKTCRDWKASGSAQVYSTLPNYISISGNTYSTYVLTNGDTSFYHAENISFWAPKKVGKFKLYPAAKYFQDSSYCIFQNIDIDVATAGWSVDASMPDNNIEITEVDLINKRIKGRFDVHLKIDFSVGSIHFPSKLYFYDGEFDLEIME